MEGHCRCVLWKFLRYPTFKYLVLAGPSFVPRVLEVEKGKLCFIIGTVYMDMPLKPNVLDDIARDVCQHILSYRISVLNVLPLALNTGTSAAL